MKKLRTITARIFSDDLLRHTSILFSGMMVVHVCSMVFQMAVSRVLPDTEYTLLMAFLAVLTIIQRPLGTLRAGVSHYSSLLQQDGRIGDVKRLLRKWLVLTGVPAVFFGLGAMLLSEPLSGFMNLDRTAPVLIAGAVLPALFCLPVLVGAGQGLQLFKWCSASTILGAVVRLGLGAGFVWFWVPACGWAMLGHGLGLYVTLAVLLAGLIVMLRRQKKTRESLPSMRFYLLQNFFIQAAYVVLMTADVVLVKHYLPDDNEFAYAATLGRMVVFLPGPIVMAMFPKVASRGAGSREQQQILVKALSWTAAFVLAAIAGCCLFPDLLVRILFGNTDVSVYLKRMIGLMAFVMGASALLNVVTQFLVAQRRFKGCIAVLAGACVYLLGVLFFHSTSWQIIGIAAVCTVGALLITCISFLKGWTCGSRE